MEPKVSMTWYAVALVVGLSALALSGHGIASAWVAVGVTVAAALMLGIYLRDRRGAAHMPAEFRMRRAEPVPRHRRVLDRWVSAQWMFILVVGGGVSRLLETLSWSPFDHVGLVFVVLSVGWVVMWAGIYISSLVDWYLILPKVSGISCPGPCERPGRQRWIGVTGLWTFHRGIARLLVPAVVIGCPVVIGALAENGTGQAVAFAVAAALSVYLIDFEAQGKGALNFALNARRAVGDTLWLVRESEEWVRHEAGYLVDVSAEGGKFKFVDSDGRYHGDAFDPKHDDDGVPIALPALNERKRVPGARPPCERRCTGINWYCWANELAYSQTSNSD